jgi:U4/U6 small nuclear ribonucleoprotein PRP31
MATLADELLNDFEESDSEGGEDDRSQEFQDDGVTNGPSAYGLQKPSSSIGASDGMILDGDEEEVEDDEELTNSAGAGGPKEQVEDEQETKARIEKMQLRGVNDVRSVAVLMKTLQPVLEVSISLPLHSI